MSSQRSCRRAVKVVVTGMSGTGKSSALSRLGARGHRVVDTDTDEWSRWICLSDGSRDWIWREEAITELLEGYEHGVLFVPIKASFTPCSTMWYC